MPNDLNFVFETIIYGVNQTIQIGKIELLCFQYSIYFKL